MTNIELIIYGQFLNRAKNILIKCFSKTAINCSNMDLLYCTLLAYVFVLFFFQQTNMNNKKLCIYST